MEGLNDRGAGGGGRWRRRWLAGGVEWI